MKPFGALLGQPALAAGGDLAAEAAALLARSDEPRENAHRAVQLATPERDQSAAAFVGPGVVLAVHARPPGQEVVLLEPRRPTEEALLVFPRELRSRRRVCPRERPHVHATSESSESASPASVCSSTSGCGSASSPSRLIQIAGSPSSIAGAMSW